MVREYREYRLCRFQHPRRKLIYQWTGGQRRHILTNIFKDKTAWGAARANVGISRPLKSIAFGSDKEQQVLQDTVNTVRRAADKPNKENTAAIISQGAVAAAAIRNNPPSVSKSSRQSETVVLPNKKFVRVIAAILFATLVATAMSAQPNPQPLTGAHGRVAGGNAAPGAHDPWTMSATGPIIAQVAGPYWAGVDA